MTGINKYGLFLAGLNKNLNINRHGYIQIVSEGREMSTINDASHYLTEFNR